jgi:hypothetical protein
MRAVLLCAALGACSERKVTTAPDAAPPPTALQPALQVSDVYGNWDAHTFPLLSRGLVARIVEPSLPEKTVLDMTWVNPRGERMLHELVPFTTNPNILEGDDPVMHDMVALSHAKPIDGGYELIRNVPLLGGPFTRVPQPDGAWGVTARLEGVPGTLTATITLLNSTP